MEIKLYPWNAQSAYESLVKCVHLGAERFEVLYGPSEDLPTSGLVSGMMNPAPS